MWSMLDPAVLDSLDGDAVRPSFKAPQEARSKKAMRPLSPAQGDAMQSVAVREQWSERLVKLEISPGLGASPGSQSRLAPRASR